MSPALNPAATHHIPGFIVAPGETDVLMGVVAVFLLAMTLIVGNLYFRLHALPEHKAHRMNRGQFEIVAILSLLALFTHNHLFWVAALLLAMVTIPDFTTPLTSIADSVGRIAGQGKSLDRNPDTP